MSFQLQIFSYINNRTSTFPSAVPRETELTVSLSGFFNVPQSLLYVLSSFLEKTIKSDCFQMSLPGSTFSSVIQTVGTVYFILGILRTDLWSQGILS